MPEVVEQRRAQRVARPLRGDALPVGQVAVQAPEPSEQARHDVGSTDRVRKAGVIGSGVREARETELADAPEPLDLAGAKQGGDDGFFV